MTRVRNWSLVATRVLWFKQCLSVSALQREWTQNGRRNLLKGRELWGDHLVFCWLEQQRPPCPLSSLILWGQRILSSSWVAFMLFLLTFILGLEKLCDNLIRVALSFKLRQTEARFQVLLYKWVAIGVSSSRYRVSVSSSTSGVFSCQLTKLVHEQVSDILILKGRTDLYRH